MAKVCKEWAELLGGSTSPESRVEAACRRAMAATTQSVRIIAPERTERSRPADQYPDRRYAAW